MLSLHSQCIQASWLYRVVEHVLFTSILHYLKVGMVASRSCLTNLISDVPGLVQAQVVHPQVHLIVLYREAIAQLGF